MAIALYLQNGKSEKLKQVEISLTDCLACSGCITSAETVLVQQQSTDEMMRIFSEQNVNIRYNIILYFYHILIFYILGP